MAKRSKRLKVVLDLAERKKKQADQLLAASRARVEKDQQAIEQLKTFLADYQRQYEDAGRQGFGIARLEVYQSFIRKISTALHQQERSAGDEPERIENCRAPLDPVLWTGCGDGQACR